MEKETLTSSSASAAPSPRRGSAAHARIASTNSSSSPGSSDSEITTDDEEDDESPLYRRSLDTTRRPRASMTIRRRCSLDRNANQSPTPKRGHSFDEARRFQVHSRRDRWHHQSRTSHSASYRTGPPSEDEEDEEDLPSETPALFGIMPWINLSHTPTEEEAKVLYRPANKVREQEEEESLITFGNVLWTLLFGWFLGLVYMCCGGLMVLTLVGKPYAKLCWSLGRYYFWPFGKYLIRRESTLSQSSEVLSDLNGAGAGAGAGGEGAAGAGREDSADGGDLERRVKINEDDLEKRPLVNPQQQPQPTGTPDNSHAHSSKPPAHADVLWEPPPQVSLKYLATAVWMLLAVFISLSHLLAMGLCWLIVFFIPMAKVNKIALTIVWIRPLEVRVVTKPQGDIVCCTYQACHVQYYRYTALGLNVVLLIYIYLVFFVFMSLIMGYLLPSSLEPPEYVLFTCCILSIIPLAYYIGMAVASIANQTNFAIGAMLNAMFGVSIEIILYGSAIMNGGLTELIQAGVVGSMLGDLLLLPGLAMIFGGIKYKEQAFSPRVAGVSSVMLIVSAIGIFTPTVYWLIAGGFNYNCDMCYPYTNSTGPHTPMACSGCTFQPTDYDSNPIYVDRARPLMYICAAILPICYGVGLLFTLKTHSYIFNNSKESEEHTGPQWSKKFSALVLASSIGLFALISEKAIEALEPTLEDIGINQLFAGITVVALVPSSAEYVNAIGFALNNNVALSLEIGATSAVQISLIMVPVLVLFSAVIHSGMAQDSLILIFPTFSLFAIIMSVVVVNYISIEGTANYFKGAVLVACYCLFISAFYFLSL